MFNEGMHVVATPLYNLYYNNFLIMFFMFFFMSSFLHRPNFARAVCAQWQTARPATECSGERCIAMHGSGPLPHLVETGGRWSRCARQDASAANTCAAAQSRPTGGGDGGGAALIQARSRWLWPTRLWRVGADADIPLGRSLCEGGGAGGRCGLTTDCIAMEGD